MANDIAYDLHLRQPVKGFEATLLPVEGFAATYQPGESTYPPVEGFESTER